MSKLTVSTAMTSYEGKRAKMKIYSRDGEIEYMEMYRNKKLVATAGRHPGEEGESKNPVPNRVLH